MKTTVEIPDDLFRSAKSRAAEMGISFRALLIDALHARINRGQERGSMEGIFGVLAGEPEAIYSVDRTIERDLEHVDPDEWR